jgi:hypothetical protein
MLHQAIRSNKRRRDRQRTGISIIQRQQHYPKALRVLSTKELAWNVHFARD